MRLDLPGTTAVSKVLKTNEKGVTAYHRNPFFFLVELREIEPCSHPIAIIALAAHFVEQKHTKSRDNNALPEADRTADDYNRTPAEQKENPISHKKYALCMHLIPTDLKLVMERCVELPDAMKAGITAMVQATK